MRGAHLVLHPHAAGGGVTRELVLVVVWAFGLFQGAVRFFDALRYFDNFAGFDVRCRTVDTAVGRVSH